MEYHTNNQEIQVKSLKQNVFDLITFLFLIPVFLGGIFILACIFVSPFIFVMYFSVPVASTGFALVILSIILLMFDGI